MGVLATDIRIVHAFLGLFVFLLALLVVYILTRIISWAWFRSKLQYERLQKMLLNSDAKRKES